MKTIPNADLKVNKTTFNTMVDLHTMLTNAGADHAEISAISDHLLGKSLLKAATENGLKNGDETDANTVNRFRGRMLTLMIAGFRTITEPAATKVMGEIEKENQENAAKSLAEQLQAWEDGGRIGRQPGVGNRPKSEIEIEKAHATARRDARTACGIKTQGRINPELQAKFVAKFAALYGKALKAISRTYDLGYDDAKIEKMVNAGIKALAVAKAAQKAVLNANANAKPKSDKPKGKGKGKGADKDTLTVPAIDASAPVDEAPVASEPEPETEMATPETVVSAE